MDKPQFSLNRNFDPFVVFDLETTGLGRCDKITEIGAVRMECGEVTDTFSSLVNPGRPIPYAVQRLTGITDRMVETAPTIEELLPAFLDFIGDCPLIAHNAPFDIGFLFRECEALGLMPEIPLVDTLRLARRVWPKLPSYKLTFLTDYFCIAQDDAHRAWCDAEATGKLYCMMRERSFKF